MALHIIEILISPSTVLTGSSCESVPSNRNELVNACYRGMGAHRQPCVV
jgi:hypothetical protein